MSRKHSYRELTLGAERRAAHLELRADLSARRSARQLGVVISLAQVAELRRAIAARALPRHVRYIGRSGAALDAYLVDFTGRSLIALHDRRGMLIATFAPAEDGVTLTPIDDDV